MRSAEAERLGQGRRPGVLGLVGQRIDQVEADPAEIALRRLERDKAFTRTVGAAEETQCGIVEALKAEREPASAS